MREERRRELPVEVAPPNRPTQGKERDDVLVAHPLAQENQRHDVVTFRYCFQDRFLTLRRLTAEACTGDNIVTLRHSARDNSVTLAHCASGNLVTVRERALDEFVMSRR